MRCLQNKTNCMYNGEGKCNILEDTHFKRPCPFYKERPPEILLDKIVDGELFRSIRGYDGKYLVSESGRIINFAGRSISQYVVAGRLSVQLTDDLTRRRVRKSVAILVADAFIPGTGSIGFIDGNCLNCNRWNLYRIGEK